MQKKIKKIMKKKKKLMKKKWMMKKKGKKRKPRISVSFISKEWRFLVYSYGVLCYFADDSDDKNTEL